MSTNVLFGALTDALTKGRNGLAYKSLSSLFAIISSPNISCHCDISFPIFQCSSIVIAGSPQTVETSTDDFGNS